MPTRGFPSFIVMNGGRCRARTTPQAPRTTTPSASSCSNAFRPHPDETGRNAAAPALHLTNGWPITLSILSQDRHFSAASLAFWHFTRGVRANPHHSDLGSVHHALERSDWRRRLERRRGRPLGTAPGPRPAA